MFKVVVRIGEVQYKGGEASIPGGEYETFEAAYSKLVRQFGAFQDTGYTTVMIAQQNPDGTYRRGPYGLNVIYQVTETHTQCERKGHRWHSNSMFDMQAVCEVCGKHEE